MLSRAAFALFALLVAVAPAPFHGHVRAVLRGGHLERHGPRADAGKHAADAVILAARFDNLKEGAPARVVAQRAASTPSRATASASSAPQS